MSSEKVRIPAAEGALRCLLHQQQEMLDAIPDLVWLKDGESRYLAANAAFDRACGVSPGELVGKTDYDVWPLDLAEQYRNDDLLVMASGKPMQVEELLEEKGGHRRWLETTKTPYLDESGSVSGTMGIARDIDARKKAENALVSSEYNYRELVERTNSIILRLDAAGRLTFCNEFALRFFGYERDELIGRPVVDTIVPQIESTGRDMRTVIAGICTSPDNYPMSENENITKDGRLVWISWANKAMTVSDGQEPEVLCVGLDITEKRRLQALMFETEKMVTICGLAAGMAHELNNPLGAIIQSVQNLRRRLTGGLVANELVAEEEGIDLASLERYLDRRGIFDMLTHMTAAGTRAADLIANMLAFSQKSFAGRASVQLTTLMDKVIDLAACDYELKKNYDFRSIAISRDYDVAVPPVVVRPAEIEQVMFNLLKNAAQALAARPADRLPLLWVKIAARNGFAVIEVADNGPGIPDSVRAHIFDPFFTTKSVGEGTGLGLSVSYAIVVQNHQGSIEVESREGEGARFTVRLPYNCSPA